VGRKQQNTNQVLEAFKILALNLNQDDYKKVCGVMFRLYMGQKFDYSETFDQQFLTDINAVWELSIPEKAKIKKFKLVKGGKDVDNKL